MEDYRYALFEEILHPYGVIQHLFASEVIALPENPCKELVCKPISPYKNSGPYGEE
jgi:hypothetical protein